ncbi:MAG: hypothetical protein ACLRXC_13175 [[Clostridium] leptum]
MTAKRGGKRSVSSNPYWGRKISLRINRNNAKLLYSLRSIEDRKRIADSIWFDKQRADRDQSFLYEHPMLWRGHFPADFKGRGHGPINGWWWQYRGKIAILDEMDQDAIMC